MSPVHHKEPVDDDETNGQSNWKPIIVAALRATEMALDGSPIPAAKTCISLVLKVIEATDVAADNEKGLQQLHVRYQDLEAFLLSITPDTPEIVRKVVYDFDQKLKRLAERWKPLLTRKPRKVDVVLKLFTASRDRDNLQGFLAETDRAINDFLIHFQVKGWIETHRKIVEAHQAAVLAAMPRAQHASYKTPRSGGPRPCLEGTRINVLNNIETWALHPEQDHPSVFWLNGIAGTGKSTIAHTVASRLDAKKQLGGSFVFLKTDDQLKNGNLVFPTLAFQLSSFDPIFKARLAQVLTDDPGCVTESPKNQFQKLIRQPLSAISMSRPLILVLDALDECQSDSLEELLWVVANSVEDIPFLRVFITSRPEGCIREGLAVDGHRSARQKLVLHEDMGVQEEVEKDIRLYLKTSLQEIWAKDNQGEWPPEKDLEILVEHSGRLFIYAATMVRFIGGHRGLDLEWQLGVLLNVNVGHIHVSDPYRRLDQLYLSILDTALPLEFLKDAHYIERFQKVVGSIVLLQKPLSLEALACFLGNYTVPMIMRTLYDLHSIIVVPAPKSPSHVVRTYHLSFPNFITSTDRCTNPNMYINPQKQELYLLLRCLDIIKKFFPGPVKHRPNVRQATVDSLGDQTDTRAVDQAQPLVNQKDTRAHDNTVDFYDGDTTMAPEVRYASNHWCSHLVNVRLKPDVTKNTSDSDEVLPAEASEQLIGAVGQFINNYLLQWLDQRVARIQLPTSRATRIKLAQDTLDIMYNAHHWVIANIDSQSSRQLKQILKDDACEAFEHLFPQAMGSYTLGDRLHELVSASPLSERLAKYGEMLARDRVSPVPQHELEGARASILGMADRSFT